MPKPIASIRIARALQVFLRLALFDSQGRLGPLGRKGLEGALSPLEKIDRKWRDRAENQARRSLVYDVLVPIYRRVKAGELEGQDEVADAIRRRADQLGFTLDDTELADLVALKDDLKRGGHGVVRLAAENVAQFVIEVSPRRLLATIRARTRGEKLARHEGLLSATPPARSRSTSADLTDVTLLALDCCALAADEEGKQALAEDIRRMREDLYLRTIRASVAPPPHEASAAGRNSARMLAKLMAKNGPRKRRE